MKEEDANTLADKTYSALVSMLDLAGLPLTDLGLIDPPFDQAANDAHKAEVARLDSERLAVQGNLDRYMDSRDAQNDGLGKDLVLTKAPQ